MSLNEASMFGGVAVGSALRGVLLLTFNYQILGLMGVFVLIGSLLFHFFTKDPTQQAK